MMKSLHLLILCLVLPIWSQASVQQSQLQYIDKVYVDNIRTVHFHVTGLFTSSPIMQLGSAGALYLAFDDLDADSKYYRYTVIHCDKSWQPSRLDFNEYVYGFDGEEIETFDRSVNTLVPFTHYALIFPNSRMEITKSGNYLLVIFLDDPKYPVITRRFMVVESKVIIKPSMQRPANVSKINTHQEIDFEVRAEHLRILDPKNEITAVVMQNGRWDNAITDLRSRFERGNALSFDYSDKIVFPAGLEFRNMDLRSTLYRSRNVFEIRRENGRHRIIATVDAPRTHRRFLTDVDLNGKFVVRSADDRRYATIKTIDENTLGELVEETTIVDATRHNLVADYLDVLFTLKVDAPYDSDVYLFGAFTDWSLRERFRMTYDRSYQAYFADVTIKQGYYDYIYVLANSDGSADELTIEGNWYEATNDYTILIYHTPFGGRYDQLVAALTVPSAR
jgi:hypothetical protein